ncbi:site-specific DNA-methyltransferase [Bifidobacterium jacchi]|uniref:Site-specific DNA-methyltransferase n=1 Tax=Bifidobacterium jacchi TaxID=2490545 RepID=A0A5N5RKA3_9BIFI|nr:site-specific DNA-methyltransferase [Bifidobacterium jacchi]KAB5607380.1 site-specific DNA-methyltransferase [Bifidobacterium jacchi]
MEVPRIEPVTPDITQENIEKILELFPNVATEVRDTQTGEVKRAVDFDALRDQLGDVAEGMRERYQFTWPGKRAAKEEARQPIAKTLRPVKERSKNWDDTKNLYIEGDNLDALKILRETYAGKIKMIYIDPPYNTGHDFIYRDNFRKNADDYAGDSGEYDEDGGRLVANPESNGRFHSDWCTMMYSRLLLARDLLTSDGVIFISIDDNEDGQLRKICDEVFGESNFIAQLIWERAFSPKNDAKYVSNSHDYILMYAKNALRFSIGRLPRTEEANARYKNPDNDPRGVWMSDNMTVKTYSASTDYPITTPSGRVVEPPAGRCWSLSKNAFLERLQDNRIWFGPNGDGVPRIKRFLSELKNDGLTPQSILFYKEVGHSQEGAKEVTALFNGKSYFDGPKPVRLLHHLITLANLDTNDTVLDFFSGSATTANALMRYNTEQEKDCSFILVQVPELTNRDRDAYKAGYHTICEIGEERIRRAGEKIKAEIEQENRQLELGAEPKQVPDIGFRVLRVDSSNYADVRRSPLETTQGNLDELTNPSKADRDSLDKLFECFPTFQLPYDSSIEVLSGSAFAGHTVYSVNGNQLVACFDTEIPESVLRGMAALDPKPSYAVVAESGLKNSQTVTNFTEIFKQAANARQGSTQIRII